ncbi:unnamed protein product, partial [Heterosigma akashiwo]
GEDVLRPGRAALPGGELARAQAVPGGQVAGAGAQVPRPGLRGLPLPVPGVGAAPTADPGSSAAAPLDHRVFACGCPVPGRPNVPGKRPPPEWEAWALQEKWQERKSPKGIFSSNQFFMMKGCIVLVFFFFFFNKHQEK